MAKGARASASTATGTNTTTLEEPQLSKKLVAAGTSGRGRRPAVAPTSSKEVGSITTLNGAVDQTRKLANGYSAGTTSSSRTEVSDENFIS
jgi:hypothetical protein